MRDRVVFEGRVESISFSGGIVRLDRKPFFVPFACPGDVVRVEIADEKKYAARLVEIIEVSPDRIEPRCPLFGICGGCTLQHISYGRQAAEKKKMVRDSFRRIGGFEALPEIGWVPSPEYGCRNRVELHSDGRNTGFKEAKSAGVVPAGPCPMAVPVVRDFIQNAAAMSRMPQQPQGPQTPLKPRVSQPGSIKRFTVYGFDNRLAVEGGDTEKLFIPDLGITMDVRIFFQSNLHMQKKLIADVVLAAGEGGTLADIYCGVGAFAHSLAARYENICLIEENPGAIALARENLRDAPSKTDYYALSAEEYCAMLARNRKGRLPRWDTVIVDPPRGGLCAPLVDLLLTLKTVALVYVSCNPATLARDAKRLCDGGFSLDLLTCYDFYPQTPHIECVALFHGAGFGR
jgi:23S rRNA (uracil1939-C5)-methyltransferase